MLYHFVQYEMVNPYLYKYGLYILVISENTIIHDMKKPFT